MWKVATDEPLSARGLIPDVFGFGRSSAEEESTDAGVLSVSSGGANGPVKVADRVRVVTEGTDKLVGAVGVGSLFSVERIGAEFIEIARGRLSSRRELANAVVGRDSVEVPGRANRWMEGSRSSKPFACRSCGETALGRCRVVGAVSGRRFMKVGKVTVEVDKPSVCDRFLRNSSSRVSFVNPALFGAFGNLVGPRMPGAP